MRDGPLRLCAANTPTARASYRTLRNQRSIPFVLPPPTPGNRPQRRRGFCPYLRGCFQLRWRGGSSSGLIFIPTSPRWPPNYGWLSSLEWVGKLSLLGSAPSLPVSGRCGQKSHTFKAMDTPGSCTQFMTVVETEARLYHFALNFQPCQRSRDPRSFPHVTPIGQLTKIILRRSTGSVLIVDTQSGSARTETRDRVHSNPQDAHVAQNLT